MLVTMYGSAVLPISHEISKQAMNSYHSILAAHTVLVHSDYLLAVRALGTTYCPVIPTPY